MVSRKTLDPSEPPLQAPRLPPYLSDPHGLERQKEEGSAPTTTPSSRVASSNPAPAGKKVAAKTTDAAGLWDYLCSHIDGNMPSPRDPQLRLLLSLPKTRDLDPVGSLSADLDEKQITGLIIQATGELAPSACTECRRHNGPFASCVRPSLEVATQFSGLLRSSYRACANCFLRKNTYRCSVRAGGIVHGRLPGPEGYLEGPMDDVPMDDVSMDDAPMDDAMLALQMSMLDRRRSARIHAQTEDYEDAEDEESSVDDEPLPPEPRLPQRLVTLKIPSRLRVANLPTEAHLHLENWEMDCGRINAAGERVSLPLTAVSTPLSNPANIISALAFSSAYLTANQTVQVSPAITFQALTIISGRVHQFSADSDKTRMCTLAGGKLSVRVGNDEFIVGAQGVFKIMPGVACTVTNKCYVDVVLHVTCVSKA